VFQLTLPIGIIGKQ